MMALFGDKGKSYNREERAAEIEQRLLLHLLMGNNATAARFLVSALHDDADSAYHTCRRALDVYKLGRYAAAKQRLREELGRWPLGSAVYDKYAMQLTDIGVLTLTSAGYTLAPPDTTTIVDKHTAMSIHHLRAGRLVEARAEARKAAQSREDKGKGRAPGVGGSQAQE